MINSKIHEYLKIGVSVTITLLFCVSMTIPAKTMPFVDETMNLLMLLLIIWGVLTSVLHHRDTDKLVALMIVAFLVARLISYKENALEIRYGGAMMLQVFFLIGVCKNVFSGRKQYLAALYSFIGFDLLSLGCCCYLFNYKKEYVARITEKYADSGIAPTLALFQNPNYVGMMTGAVIVICFGAILNNHLKAKNTVLNIVIIVINAYVLIKHTGCRSAETGVCVVVLVMLVLLYAKKYDSLRMIIGTSLILCFLALIPIYMLVYSGDNENYLSDISEIEKKVESFSTGRYAIWKSSIISQEGHVAFGFGNSTTAWDARKELVNNFDRSKTDITYFYSLLHKRQHNGYIAVYNEAGIVGAICLLLLLLARIRNLKGRFRDGQWEKLLLIYIFWINLFEAKFVLHVFFTGFLMMVLLLPTEEEQSNQLRKTV